MGTLSVVTLICFSFNVWCTVHMHYGGFVTLILRRRTSNNRMTMNFSFCCLCDELFYSYHTGGSMCRAVGVGVLVVVSGSKSLLFLPRSQSCWVWFEVNYLHFTIGHQQIQCVRTSSQCGDPVVRISIIFTTPPTPHFWLRATLGTFALLLRSLHARTHGRNFPF